MKEIRRLRAPSGSAGARIVGVGGVRGDRIVANADLAEAVGTSDEWIRQRVGIVNRRFASEDQSVVTMAAEAARRAIVRAGMDAADIDLVLVATCTMPAAIPNASARVADLVGARAAAAFDLNAACAGFCYALSTASGQIRAGNARNVLVIGAERFTDWLDWSDRSTSIIFGDGAGAVIVGPSSEPRVGPPAWGSAGDLADHIYLRENKYFFQEGRAVYRWVTTQVAPVAARAVELAGLELADVDAVITHQANLRIIEAITDQLQQRGARKDLRVARDIIHTGNTSAASIPLAMEQMSTDGQIHSGDVLLLVGFGAGLSYAGQVVICP